MNYILEGSIIKGMILDDELKEIHILVDISVGIEGADLRFIVNNPNIDFLIKGFNDYDQLSAQVKEKAAEWVSINYPNT